MFIPICEFNLEFKATLKYNFQINCQHFSFPIILTFAIFLAFCFERVFYANIKSLFSYINELSISAQLIKEIYV